MLKPGAEVLYEHRHSGRTRRVAGRTSVLHALVETHVAGADDLKNLELIVSADRLVKKRKDLVIAGDEYRSLCFVKDGYAIRYKVLRSGKRQILNVVLPGDVIGFPVSFFDRSIYSIVAVSDLTYNSCPLGSYVRLCYEQPQFGLALSWLAAHEAAIYAEHIVDLGRRTPLERLGHFFSRSTPAC